MMWTESSGGVKSVIPNDCHISLVPELIRNAVPKQERPARRKDSVLPPGGLLSGI